MTYQRRWCFKLCVDLSDGEDSKSNSWSSSVEINIYRQKGYRYAIAAAVSAMDDDDDGGGGGGVWWAAAAAAAYEAVAAAESIFIRWFVVTGRVSWNCVFTCPSWEVMSWDEATVIIDFFVAK